MLASSGWSWNKLWPDPLKSSTRLTFPAPPYPLALILCFSRLFDFVFSFLISENVSFHNSLIDLEAGSPAALIDLCIPKYNYSFQLITVVQLDYRQS
jgi:hypothetical protein